MWSGLSELVDFSDPAGEILKTLGGGSPGQSLVAAVQPAMTSHINNRRVWREAERQVFPQMMLILMLCSH